jgi:hypothetical protein
MSPDDVHLHPLLLLSYLSNELNLHPIKRSFSNLKLPPPSTQHDVSPCETAGENDCQPSKKSRKILISLFHTFCLHSLFAEQHNFRKAYKYDEIASDTFFY